MTDLFDLPATPEPRLAVARRRLAAAERAWDECREMDNSPIRGRIGAEAEAAKRELREAEREELARRR